MSSPRSSEARDLIREVEQLGVRVERAHNNHFKVFAPQRVVFIPSSPSDWRSLSNCRSKLRRAGVPIGRVD